MQKISNKEIKDIMYSLGADLCGVASIERFEDAPKGFHPLDVFPRCKSVISFAVRFPVGALLCNTPVPYTRIRNSLTPKMDAIALDFCIELEKRGIVSVPIPTNESLWDENTNRWRSIISQKHAAQAAGLGTVGRHTLLITPQFGSMVWLGCILCDAEIEPDKMLEKYRCHGIGSRLMDVAEQVAKEYSDTVWLGVGLHSGYGSAQRMYCKRGYIPDGIGVWYGDKVAEPYQNYCNDDELVLYFSKKLI